VKSLLVAQSFKKHTALYGNQRLRNFLERRINVPFPSQMNSVHTFQSFCATICLQPRFPSGKFSLGFPTKTVCAFLFSPHVSPLTSSPKQYLLRTGHLAIVFSLLCIFPLNPQHLPRQPILEVHHTCCLPITFNLCTQNRVVHVFAEVFDCLLDT